MKPAFSVIFFTVASGFGLGLFALLALADLAGLGGGLTRNAIVIAGVVALALTTAGLFSSTLHLANPKNAWRAFSRFKTSWLSREGVFAVVFYPFALAYLASAWFGGPDKLHVLLGVGAIVLAVVVVYCTGMIYACLKTIPQWHSRLVPLNYLLLGGFSASLALLAVALADGARPVPYAALALLLGTAAAIFKGIYYHRFRAPVGKHTLAGAIGMTAAQAKLLDAGHTHGTFLTKEFGFQLARSNAVALRYAVFAATFLVPFLVLATGVRTPAVVGFATLVALGGLLAERWLFFAEARHVVNLYHGVQRV
jgi:DMSO reductase anchor subunit